MSKTVSFGLAANSGKIRDEDVFRARTVVNRRINIVGILFGLLILVIFARLFFWQIVRKDDLNVISRSQYLRGEQVKAERGGIFASDLHPLAVSRRAWTLWAEPQKFNKDKKTIARNLAKFTVLIDPLTAESAELVSELIGSEESRLYRLIAREDARWVLLREKLSDEQKSQIEELGIAGVGFNEDQARLYPEASLAAHLLGFVGKNKTGQDQGYFGLEGFYDVTLSGKAGYSRREKDAKGNPIPFGIFSEVKPLNGLDIVTFIDRRVQWTIENKIKEGVEKYGAKSGFVIVMRPTGEVLGMANYPSYEPAYYNSSDSSLFKNPAVSDSFEPGSVFKVLVMAGALDAGAVEPDTKCDMCAGPIRIDKYTIKTYNGVYYPETSMEDVILHSDNTGMVFAARRLGLDKLLEYLERFGIGQPVGIELEEEANPGLRDKGRWGEVELATSAFGQGIALTGIQFARAFAALANDGILPQVRIVEKLIGPSWEQANEAKEGRRVISAEAARKIADMMVRSVDQGEGVIKWAKPQGFKIAGKSGTAQVPEGGKYTERTIASFVGFAPADPNVGSPKFVMFVSLKEPTANPWGANTAAPIWFSIARDLFPYFGIQPSN